MIARRLALLSLVAALACPLAAPSLAQSPTPTPVASPAGVEQVAPVPTEWILRYEQAYGFAGLYVPEPKPAPNDRAGIQRDHLVALTLAARQLDDEATTPTLELLHERHLVPPAVAPPAGVRYLYNPGTGRFVSTEGGLADIVLGAMAQLQATEEYRRTVAYGSPALGRAWDVMLKDPQLPRAIGREIETRRYALSLENASMVRDARRTQELLQELNDAIQLAAAGGMLKPGQAITMPDVGRTGLIDFLEALPRGGKYQVTKVGEPPSALVNGKVVPLDPKAVNDALREETRRLAAQRPDYPPALALRARYEAPDEAARLLDEAIRLWPDAPALRLQRLATNAQRLDLDAANRDLNVLLAQFPAAPILIEIEAALVRPELGNDKRLRADVTSAMADVRPEVLPVQLMAIAARLDIGDVEGARALRARVAALHPGYEPLLREAAPK